MMLQTDDRRWRLRPDVVSTVLSEGAVILDLRSKFFYSANPTAWAIAQMFETGATRSEIHLASRRWGAGHTNTRAIDDVIDRLIAEGLVEPTDAHTLPGVEVTVTGWVTPVLSKHLEPLQRIMVSAFDPGLPLAE
jgi:hypothetical protein